MRHQETLLATAHRIHIAKMITWRLSGSFAVGVTIVGAEAIMKTLLYYFHERAWFSYATRHNLDQ